MTINWKGMVAATLLGLATALPAAAQTKADLDKIKPNGFPPSQPPEITVVYPAGGGADVTARLLARTMEQVSGHKYIVNNRTGGAGMVGHTWLATQAPHDGTALGMVVSLVWGDAMLRGGGRWAYTDLEPIGYLNSDPLLWFVSGSGPYANMNVKEIAQAAKDKPGTIRVATVPGSMWDYNIDQVEANTGAKFLRVPFQSGGAAATALLGNNVDIGLSTYGEGMPHLPNNRFKAAGVASAKRLAHAPNIPTLTESFGGGEEYVWVLQRFVVVPKGVPADRKAYLSAVVKAAMKDPGLLEEYKKYGVAFDQDLVDAPDVATALNKYAEKERAFYVKTGRLKD